MFQIKTPATTANLGPGFDVLGLALELYNVFEIEIAENFEFINFEAHYSSESNLIIVAYKKVFEYLNLEIIPIKLTQILQDIPNSRGLGSSSSCIACGVVAANKILNNKLSNLELLTIATELEGHPDNVAPCLFGGLVASKELDSKVYSFNYEVNPNLNIYAIIPNFTLKTSESRAALPKTISLASAVKNSANLLLLTEALKGSDQNLLNHVIVDYIHTGYREHLIHEYQQVKNIFSEKAVTISGAGPTVLALSFEKLDLKQIQNELNKLKNNWQVLNLTINYQGTVVIED